DMRRAVPLIGRLPWLAGPMLRSLPKAYQRDARAAWESQFGRDLRARDRQELDRPGVRDNILGSALEALRAGSSGVADELPLFLGKAWGFSPSALRVPTWLWYGQADVVTPAQMGSYLAAEIP